MVHFLWIYASPLNENNYNILIFFFNTFFSRGECKEEGGNSVCKLSEQHPAEIHPTKMCVPWLFASNRCAGLAQNNSLMLSPLQLYLFLGLAAATEISLLPCCTQPQWFVIPYGWGLQWEQGLSAVHRGKGSRRAVSPPFTFWTPGILPCLTRVWSLLTSSLLSEQPSDWLLSDSGGSS